MSKPQHKWEDINSAVHEYVAGGEDDARQAFADAVRHAREEGRKEGRAEGFAAAREMAAQKALAVPGTVGAGRIAADIRAMQDGRAGEDAPNPTARCRCGKVAREHDDSAPWACAASGCAGFRWQARP